MVQTHMNDKFKETIQNPAVLMKFMIAKTRSSMVSSLINIPYPACVVVWINFVQAELYLKSEFIDGSASLN